MMNALLPLLAAAAPRLCDTRSKPAAWEHVGPAGYDDGKGGIASAGAAQAAVHLNGTEWLLATANGGIWKTEDITASPEPSWTQVLDASPVTCTSISAMSEAVAGTVLAGCGAATSSEMGYEWDVANSGDWTGVMLSRDAGQTWVMTRFPANRYVSALLVLDADTFVVGVRSELFLPLTGGVYKSTDGGKSWTQVFSQPVFDLRYRAPHLLAAVPWAKHASASLYVSPDGGDTFAPWAAGLDWGGHVPYYPTFAVGEAVVFVGALTVDPKNLSDTSSALFVRDLAELPAPSGAQGAAGAWRAVAHAPRLDEDGMPKDRMALLVDPTSDARLFVAGNAGALA